MAVTNVSRRAFLGGIGALMLAVTLPRPAQAAAASDQMRDDTPEGRTLNAFVRVTTDGWVVVTVPSSEMGQGSTTGLAMVVAEELDADWSQIRIRTAEHDKVYGKPIGPLKMMVTGGSDTTSHWQQPMREMGAAARAMLVAAAAERWGVNPSACTVEEGVVKHGDDELPFGDLAEDAARQKPPKKPTLKSRDQYRIVGTDVRRLDTEAKVTGQAEFGADVRLPGMVYATTIACPVREGRLGSVDDSKAREMPGVIEVMAFDEFVAVVADHWWQARQASEALEITWDEGEHANLSSTYISETLRAGLDDKPDTTSEKRGKGDKPLKDAEGVIEATYEAPYLDHVTMAPLNATARVTDDGVEVWAPTQAQTIAMRKSAKLTGHRKNDVKVYTTFLGGGFGRRGNTDDVEQVVQIANRMRGRPVQLIWTREEGLRHGFYRPAMACRMCGLLAGDRLDTLHLKACGDNVLKGYLPGILMGLKAAARLAVEGLVHLPYDIENVRVDYVRREFPIDIGFWRSVGHSHNAFFAESFIDELAHAAGKDPLEFRLAMMDAHPRHRRVLEQAADAAGWGSTEEGRAQGIAINESFGSIVAEVAECSVTDGELAVHRITAAIDCGPVVHPVNVEAQVMGGALFGLSEALYGRISFENGRVQQNNFHDYRVLRMNQAPPVDVHIIDNPDGPMGGVGEPGVPPIAPAVCNAVFAATGQRIRTLPIAEQLKGDA